MLALLSCAFFFHQADRVLFALSVHQSALYVGLMFSGALVAWALHLFGGWRPVFFTFGGLGFILGIVFIWALKDGERGTGNRERGTATPALSQSLRA